MEISELGNTVHLAQRAIWSFAHFVPKEIVRRVIDNSISTELGGVKEEITVIFTDVRDFTAIAESADPDILMHQTSRYFSVLTEAFLAEGGTVDKFIGDAVMVFWNAPNPQPDHVERACRAALAGKAACEKLNIQFEAEGLKPFFTRFGVHVGEAVVGNLGSMERMNYTALGNTVNLAARLEGLNKQLGTAILVSGDVYLRVQHCFQFRAFESIVAKGMTKETRIFELVGDVDMTLASILRGVVSCLLALQLMLAVSHAGEDTIKVGILHSLSGTMAISELVLKDTVRMLIADQNKKGGLLGRKLEPIIVDPASDWDVFAEKAQELLTKQKVAVVFGCWTSASRKSVLPIFEQLNGLLFYPVQYEGEESSRNIFYTGATPNQQAIPAVRYLMSKEGGEVRRWVLLGTDYVYPRTTNRILSAFLAAEAVLPEDIMTIYTPFGHSDWREIIARIKAFGSEGKKTAVISTINGDANTYFYNELAAQQVDASTIPVMAFSIGERELRSAGANHLTGQMAAWNYFQSIKSPENEAFIKMWADFNDQRDKITNDPMEATFIGFRMWAQAVVQAGTTDVDAVRQAMYGQRIKAPSGFEVVMNTNHHLSKPIMIGKINSTGTFDVIWRSINPIRADAWSRYIPESAKRTADWTFPWVCGGCIEPTFKDW